MKRAEFYSIVSCISRCATNWSHEGVILSLARGKGDEEMLTGSTERFCREIRSFIEDIESQTGPRT